MQTTVHLISMPMCIVTRPSIQLGALKAYLDGAGLGVAVHTYSAFLGVLLVEPDSPVDVMSDALFFDRVDSLDGCLMTAQLQPNENWVSKLDVMPVYTKHRFGETPYFLLYYQKWLRSSHLDLEDETKPYGGIVAFESLRIERLFRSAFGSKGLGLLEERTDAYIESRIIPQLSRTGLNIVGFTCTFDQTYASLYCLRRLQELCPDVRFLFVFGGSSMGLPSTHNLLKTLGIDALCVIGEGERKLEAIVKHCSSLPDDTAPSTIRVDVRGVVHVADPIDYYDKQESLYDGQVEKLDALPPPDYDEYFKEFELRCTSPAEYRTALSKQIELQLEGSRGCVFHCTFCNLNYVWDGYRSQSAAKVLESAALMQKKYGRGEEITLRFVDNLANWSASVAQVALDRGLRFPAFLELRAKYPEEYWVKLDRIGVWQVQVGIEAYSTALLSLMEKKTRAIDNVRAHKYMTELGLSHGSNIITEYPDSTLEMIEETRRVLGYITHFSALTCVEFLLVEGSPLYNRLPRETRHQLKPMVSEAEIHPGLRSYVASHMLQMPSELALPREVDEAWKQLDDWYSQALSARPRFTVERVGDTRRLIDTRGAEPKQTVVAGPAARVLDACHKPLTLEEIGEATGLGLDIVRSAIEELAETRALLFLDDEYITVALRPKEELIANFEAARRSKPRPAALAVMQP